MSKPQIIFFGTPEFSVKILEAMKNAGFAPALIVTTADKPAGRGKKLTPPPVKSWNIKHEALNIKILQPNNLKDPKFALQVSIFKPDLFIVASYGKILPKEILDIPKHGTLNVHPSLLPKLRGPSPIQTAILNGDKETGATIMLMNERMDEGPILAQQELEFSIFPPEADPPLADNFQFSKLENELAKLGGKLLTETIPKWLNGEIKPIPQNNNEATYSKLITKKDGEINWDEPAKIIERKIRAFTPWPGAYTFINGKRVIITRAELDKNNALIIKRVKPEGKNEIDYQEYLKGNPPVL